MVKKLIVSFFVCSFVQNVFSQQLEVLPSGRNTTTSNSHVRQINFPDGFNVSYIWHNGKVIRRQLDCFDNNSNPIMSDKDSDRVAQKIIQRAMKKLDNFPDFFELLLNACESSTKGCLMVQGLWSYAASVYINNSSVINKAPIKDRQILRNLIEEMHLKKFKYSYQKSNLGDKNYIKAMIKDLKLLSKNTLIQMENIKRNHIKLDKNDSRPISQRLTKKTQTAIQYVKQCNGFVGESLQKILDTKSFILSDELTKGFDVLNKGGTIETESEIVYGVELSAKSFMKNKIQIFPGILSEDYSSALLYYERNTGSKRYFQAEGFKFNNISTNPDFWDAFWLVHEYGHIVQGNTQRNLQNAEFSKDYLKVIQKYDPDLAGLIQKIVDSYDEITESSATHYAMDIMAPCF